MYFITNINNEERVRNVNRFIDSLKLRDTYDVVIFPAIIGNDFKINQNKFISPGMIGCYLSHYVIFQEAIRNGEKEIIICEDDINLNTINFIEKIQEVRNSTPDDYTFLFLGYHTEVSITPINDLVGTSNRVTGTQCYMINIEQLKKNICLFERMNDQIDLQIAELSRKKMVSVFVSNENLATQLSVKTQVQNTSNKKSFKELMNGLKIQKNKPKFPIIGVCGIYRSGSTFQRNLIKTILKLNDLKVLVGDNGFLQRQKIDDFNNKDIDVLIYKTHEYNKSDREKMNIIFTSYRNLDEIQPSWQRISNREITNNEVQHAYKNYLNWEQVSDYDMSFYDIKENKEKIVSDVIKTLENKLSNFKNKIPIEIIIAEMELIKPPKSGFDYNTGLFHNHIGV